MFKLRVTMAVVGVFHWLSASGPMGELLARPPLGQQVLRGWKSLRLER